MSNDGGYLRATDNPIFCYFGEEGGVDAVL